MIGNRANFMHGFSVRDDQGNVVRILDFIYGRTIADHVRDLASKMDHETYFYKYFPDILENFIACVEAIRFLHEQGEKHGDIRRDHILWIGKPDSGGGLISTTISVTGGKHLWL